MVMPKHNDIPEEINDFDDLVLNISGYVINDKYIATTAASRILGIAYGTMIKSGAVYTNTFRNFLINNNVDVGRASVLGWNAHALTVCALFFSKFSNRNNAKAEFIYNNFKVVSVEKAIEESLTLRPSKVMDYELFRGKKRPIVTRSHKADCGDVLIVKPRYSPALAKKIIDRSAATPTNETKTLVSNQSDDSTEITTGVVSFKKLPDSPVNKFQALLKYMNCDEFKMLDDTSKKLFVDAFLGM